MAMKMPWKYCRWKKLRQTAQVTYLYIFGSFGMGIDGGWAAQAELLTAVHVAMNAMPGPCPLRPSGYCQRP